MHARRVRLNTRQAKGGGQGVGLAHTRKGSLLHSWHEGTRVCCLNAKQRSCRTVGMLALPNPTSQSGHHPTGTAQGTTRGATSVRSVASQS
eukprot:1270977-Prymnesium_polylepis.1